MYIPVRSKLVSPPGGCVGKIVRRNLNYRITKKMDSVVEKVNFYVYYDIDGDEVKTAFRIEEWGGDDESAWMLLEMA